MSQGNVEIVRELFERWNRGERWFSDDEVDSEMQVISRFQAEPYRGRDGLRRWMNEIDEAFQDWQLVAYEWREVGDLVVGRGHIQLRGKEGGVGFDQPMGWLIEVKEGRLAAIQNFLNPDDAFEAVGLSE